MSTARKTRYLLVVWHRDSWAVRRGDGPIIGGSKREYGDTKKNAIAFAANYAQSMLPAEILIYTKDGRIQARKVYG